jgi:anti-sigma factor RsiW
VIGHLGTRVSALLDGQMSPADEERAWEHVHTCHQCRDAVEHEGWVKTRLATMQLGASATPSHLKGSLLVRGIVDWPDLPAHPALADDGARRRHLGMSGIGSGAVGAAVMGVLALGASPANAPGAAVGQSDETFGATLTHAITSVVYRDPPSSGRDQERRDTPAASLVMGRTLAP